MITVHNAVKKYGRGESEIYALNHVELEIPTGEICVILGPSGSGKSTLLNMPVGFVLALCICGRKLGKVDPVESLKCPME